MADPEEQGGVDASAAEAALAAVIGELVQEAAVCGATALATGLRAAISPTERGALLLQLRRAFTARSRAEELEARLALLGRVERTLDATDAALVEAAERPAPVQVGATCGEPVENTLTAVPVSGRLVDVVDPSGHPPAMSTGPLPAMGTDARAKHIARLVEQRDDAALVELATSIAGSQGKLAALAGLAEESISRGKSGHRAGGFSEATRTWLQGYLLNPKAPPPPMERRAGPKPRPGARAPQVWIDEETHAAFTAAAERFGGQSPVLNYLVDRYLKRHRRRLIPAPEVPEGGVALRVRIAPELLAALDTRAGGAGARAGHLRAAIVEGLPDLRKKRHLPRAA